MALEVNEVVPHAPELEAALGSTKLRETIALKDFYGTRILRARSCFQAHQPVFVEGQRDALTNGLSGDAFANGGFGNTEAKLCRVEVLAPDTSEVHAGDKCASIASNEVLKRSVRMRFTDGHLYRLAHTFN